MIIPNWEHKKDNKMIINLDKKKNDEGTYTFKISFKNPLYKEEKNR